jgi:U2-associated protein SR140
MMRWGKNVKRSVRQGTGGGFEVAPMKKVEQAVARPGIEYQETIPMEEESLSNVPVRFNGLPHIIQFNTDSEGKDISRAIEYDSTIHGAHAIRVEMLTNPKRFHFVSTVAKYVAKDGSDLEKKLIEKEAGNQLFNFLTLNHASTEQRKEHIFYRWRVYSFCQGGGYLRWRTEPFIMFLPHGKFWVPPPLNEDIRQKVEASNEVKPREKEKKKDDRRHLPREIEYMTGRQFERARGSRRKRNRRGLSEGRATMIEEEEEMFDFLVKKKLTISREAICQAMAFCFERSGSAREISELLKASLVDDAPFISVDTKIARLYLLSDILFNSQQPGVKNAFMYRDSIEKMAPEVFTSLGRNDSKDGSIGRMTMHKLRTAIKTVLGAWAEWSVYNPSFLDELEARFEGKEIKIVEEETKADVPEEKEEVPPEPVEIIIKTPMGRFIEFSADEMVDSFDRENGMAQSNTSDAIESERKSRQGKNNEKDDDVDDNPVEEDIDGQAAQHGRNVNGIPADQQDLSAEVDGSPIENIDGSSVSEEDIDGEPAEENNVDKIPVGEEDLRDTTAGPTDIDGEELDEMSEEDIDGSSLASGDIDIDGEDLDIDDLDGEDLDGEEM